MQRNPVGWFEIYVSDMQRARKFYETVLRYTLEHMAKDDFDLYVFPMQYEAPGGSGALVHMEGAPVGGSNTIVYFTSPGDDCAVEESRVVPAGGQIHKSKMSIGEHGFMVLAYDTEGNMFGIHSMK